jgi:hypothetical protein
MGKKLINTSTNLDLSLDVNKGKLKDLENGELVVQSSKAGELKIWGKTVGGEVVSLPTRKDVTDIINETLENKDLEGYVKPENLNKINGNSLYNADGKPINIELGSGTITEDDLKNYAKTSEVYTKDSINMLLDSKVTVGNVYTKSDIDKELNKKADKLYTYTKDEVDELVSTVPTFEIEVVDKLPTENISETTLYLLTLEESVDGTLYSINIYSKGEWKKLGEQSINFNDYYNKEETVTEINTAIDNKLKNYYEISLLDSLLAEKVSVESFQNIIANYYNKSEIDEDYYKKSEIDGFLKDIEIPEEQLKEFPKKSELKTINGASLIIAEGGETNIKIESNVDIEELQKTFVEKSVYETDLNTKLDTTIFDARVKVVDDELGQKADTTYVTDYVDQVLNTTGTPTMVVLPESFYNTLETEGRVTYEGVEYIFNESIVYYLYENEEE